MKNAKKTVNVKRAEALFAKIKKEGPVENPDFTVEGMLLLLQDPVLSLYDSHQAALSLWFGVGKPYLDTEKGGRNDFFTSSEIAAFLQQNDLSYSFSSNYKNGIKSFISFLRHHPQQPLCSTAVLQKRQAEKDAKKLATKKEMSQAFLASLPHVLARLQEQVKEALDCLGITSQQAERQSLLVSSLAFTPIHELELTVRSLNVLKSMNINYLGELVTYSEGDLLKVPNCGRKSINEIREVLASRGIALRAVPGVSR